MEQEKREWLTKVNREFGDCSFVAYLKGVPIGFIQYAPAEFFPRINDYDSGPPSEDSIFLACLYIPNKEKRGKGLGTALLNHLVAKLKEREIEAVETFARKDSENNPSGPLKLYLKHHFKVKRDKDDFPLIRLEL